MRCCGSCRRRVNRWRCTHNGSRDFPCNRKNRNKAVPPHPLQSLPAGCRSTLCSDCLSCHACRPASFTIARYALYCRWHHSGASRRSHCHTCSLPGCSLRPSIGSLHHNDMNIFSAEDFCCSSIPWN